ncbi:glycogen debranching protein GlgX [Vibrio sp. SS-MA-C1-2]|uniref:glycogen debranching protein GlgX n=1 Tax=Vibrio sp. SS-MA-C1-2 TaxID=2908646 RepID=UPI001F163124|nr:glycogen debranching protein GlgX [Vibrio sp. SS-MA-C1-2]UJF16812.1 glycogen debranching protein GlgX [Vibrio sp. SS-MA-C1-2]
MLLKSATPYPLGSTIRNNGCNFAIHAPHCQSIELVIFDQQDNPITYPLDHEYLGVHYTFVEGISAETKYGFRVIQDQESYLLIDPYAKKTDKSATYTGQFTAETSWDFVKSVVIDDNFDWQDIEPPYTPVNETILFEAHPKGLTKLNNKIPEELRGTYLGLADPATIDFIKQQGVTSIQLMPVAASLSEPHLERLNKINYWGYNPLLFMAPEPRYAVSDPVNELKTAIRELHRNGIEVILDVVYNHTAESGKGGPILNLKALDPNYYIHNPASGSHFNYSGCGNTLDLTHQPTLNLVMDSLRYWVEYFHIDGFRFDLAATLGRQRENFDSQSALFKAIAQDPILRTTKLIAEPWDIGPNGYQLGHFPDRWHECNDKYRDTTRSFWRGDNNCMKDFATRLMGSRDLFSAGRWPQKLTVNYITYHDGFTLQDLVSYQNKHNEANGEDNRDGHGDNRSSNNGIEGVTINPAIIKLRQRQKRNMITSLLFSFGIPHLLAVDSFSHSQKGNNNAYCQDNELSWPDWQLDPKAEDFSRWQSQMVEARKKYMLPIINAFSGKGRELHRINWRRPDGEVMTHNDWFDIQSLSLHIGLDKQGDELLWLINPTNIPVRYRLPAGSDWQLISDTITSVLGKENDKHHRDYSQAAQSISIFYRRGVE